MSLRAFDIREDMDVMIPLIQAAFHYPENEDWNLNPEEIISFVDGFRLIRALYPLFQIAGVFNPTLKAMIQGYIWEESEQAVGLVNLSPMGLDSQTWAIGNVAVLPEHRRKGIARQLIQAALDLARQHKIKNVVLEVIADNVPAVKLYENIGFEVYSSVVQLNRDAALDAPPLSDWLSDYQIEPYHIRDWESRYTLMRNITPPSVQHYEPINEKKFRKPLPMQLFRSLIMAVAPVKNTAYLVRHQTSGAVVAYVACYQRRKAGGINEVEVYLDPKHAALAPYLVNSCVHKTYGRDIELRVPKWQENVLQAALSTGFVYRAEWYTMGIHLT